LCYKGLVDLAEARSRMAALDAVYRPVAKAPVDLSDPEAFKTMGQRITAALAELAVDDEAEAVLRSLIALYEAGDDQIRVTIRRLFDRYTSFRWAAHLPRDWNTAADFRDRLIHMSACDQGADTRDEILALQALCDRARLAGIDVNPILDEVAAMSSGVDRYGMGSMRYVLLHYGQRRSGWGARVVKPHTSTPPARCGQSQGPPSQASMTWPVRRKAAFCCWASGWERGNACGSRPYCGPAGARFVGGGANA
jgi:hypothetical protein